MAESATLKVAGIPIALRPGQSFAWSLTMGTQAYQTLLTTTRSVAERIFSASNAQFVDNRPSSVGPLELELASPGHPTVKVRGVYCLATQPSGDHLHQSSLLLTDARSLLPRIAIDRAYNIRVDTGTTRLVGSTLTPIQVAQIGSDARYRRTSTVKGKPWTARGILVDVLTELFGAQGFVFDAEPTFSETIEDLYVVGQGDQVLPQVLAAIPGTQGYMGLDGLFHVCQLFDGSELGVLERLGAPNDGSWQVADRRNQRPPGIVVHFDQLIELRFDHLTQEGTRTRDREPLYMENVVQVTDPQLTLADGRVVTAGTYITIDEAIAAYNLAANGAPTVAIVPLSQDLIRKHVFRGLEILHTMFGNQLPGLAQPLWLARIAALADAWRSTFRILPEWRERIRQLFDRRVAIVDPENLTPARADAYYDHTTMPTLRAVQMSNGNDIGWVNQTSYNADLSNSSGPSPANVTLISSDQGIIKIEPRTDPAGLGSAIIPAVPTSNLAEFTAGSTRALLRVVEASEDWRCAVVLSAQKDAPNGLQRRLAISSGPEAAARKLGRPVSEARDGMTYQVIANDEVARFAWLDSLEQQIREAFYSDDVPMPKGALTNEEVLQDIADSIAAKIYVTYEDRAEGLAGWPLHPEVTPTGSLQQVIHFVVQGNSSARTGTRCVMPPLLQAPSTESLLSGKTRRKLRGLVEQ